MLAWQRTPTPAEKFISFVLFFLYCFINISFRDHSGWWIGRNDNIVWFDVLRVLKLGPSSVDGWASIVGNKVTKHGMEKQNCHWTRKWAINNIPPEFVSYRDAIGNKNYFLCVTVNSVEDPPNSGERWRTSSK